MTSTTPTTQPTPEQELFELYQLGRHHEVVARSQALAISAQGQPLAAQLLAASLFQLGEYSRAASLLEDLEAPLGQDRDYLSLYGATCRRLGLLQKAEQLLAKALQLDPTAPQVRNNYANLLIDLGRVDQARELLEQLLREQPDYQDARVNLNRLQFRAQPAAPAQFATALPEQSAAGGWAPADPLMLAFAEEEVRLAGGVQPPQLSSADQSLLGSLPAPQPEAMASEQLQLATRAVAEGNSEFALQLCGQALQGLGANAGVYANASDAYIRSRRFSEAEICLLHAIAIGGPTINLLINLVSLTSLRGDVRLAQHYLDQAAGLDPTHPQLSTLRSNLTQREQALAAQPYRFQPRWPEPQLQ
jgi:Flp pilus assembly protein TadD